MSTADVQLANLLRLDWSVHAPRPELGEDEWNDVVCKALHHGVAGLLCRVITARQVHTSRATANAAHAYLIHAKREGEARVRATLEIVDTLRGDGIEALAFKGIALGALAHDDARLRPSVDIDVLVRQQDMARAVASLARVGYRQTDQLSERALAACYATYGQEILFAPGRLPVEPHWTFVPRPFSVDIDVDAMWRRRMAIEVEGRILETLSIEDTLLVACLHGAKERWWRLLWVADIAALIARRPAIDWDAITAQATKSRIVRILHLGLGLTNALFATPLPHRIERAIASDGTCRRLIDESKRNLAADRAGREALLRVSRFHLAARERLRDRVRYVARTITTPRFVHYRMVALPDALAFGYVPVKLVHDYLLLPIWVLGKGRLWRRNVEVRKSS